MQVTVLHRLPGRMRVAYDRKIGARRATLVQSLLLVQEGMIDVSLNTIRGTLLLRYNRDLLEEIMIMTLFHAITPSYLNDPKLLEAMGDVPKQESLLATLVGMVVWHKLKQLLLPPVFAPFVTLFAIAPRLREGWHEIRAHHYFNSHTLDATALASAYAMGDRATAGSVNLLLNIGETIEDATRRISYENLSRTLVSANEKVHLLKDGTEHEVPLMSLQKGDEIILRSGEMIPVDAVVLKGDGLVNQAGITGESVAIYRTVEDSLFAGTLLEEGEFIACVQAVGQRTKCQRILSLIDESASLKANAQQRAEQLADKLVPYNFLLALGTFLITRDIRRAVSTLMVDYSCAMKLAAPIAVLSAMRQCALAGILTKGGKCIEALATADTLFVDKTGTLTASTPTLSAVIPLGSQSEDEVLRLAACLEEHFPHPLARAVTSAAEARHLNHRERHTKVENIVAHGIVSSIDGERVMIGSSHFVFEDMKIRCSAKAKAHMTRLADQGISMLCLAQGKRLIGLLGIHDPVRSEVPGVLAALRKLGFKRIVMLTGDTAPAAKTIATQLGLDGYHAQLLPEDKLRLVKEAKAAGHHVVMLGDGINDAPALAEATVGIAMNGSPGVTGQTADIILPHEGFLKLPLAREISMQLLTRMKVNNTSIIGVNSALIAAQLFGNLPNATAAFMHNASTVAIAANAMRPMVRERKSR